MILSSLFRCTIFSCFCKSAGRLSISSSLIATKSSTDSAPHSSHMSAHRNPRPHSSNLDLLLPFLAVQSGPWTECSLFSGQITSTFTESSTNKQHHPPRDTLLRRRRLSLAHKQAEFFYLHWSELQGSFQLLHIGNLHDASSRVVTPSAAHTLSHEHIINSLKRSTISAHAGLVSDTSSSPRSSSIQVPQSALRSPAFQFCPLGHLFLLCTGLHDVFINLLHRLEPCLFCSRGISPFFAKSKACQLLTHEFEGIAVNGDVEGESKGNRTWCGRGEEV
jgi:hypothetical protein